MIPALQPRNAVVLPMPPAIPPRPTPHLAVYQTGTASWYGYHWKGNRTADGERFNPNGFTCAHRTLPLGSIIRVVDPKTHKSVVVKVNDRGPYVGHRIVDLSERAARVLGFMKKGLAYVKIEVLYRPSEHRPEEVAMSSGQ